MLFFKKNKTYYISTDNEDWVAPEETLLDADSEYSDMEKPITDYIFRTFTLVTGSILLVIVGLVFKLSVIDNEIFASLAFQNRSANFPLPPPRGIIADRSGMALARNMPIFNILAVTREIKENSVHFDADTTAIADALSLDLKPFQDEIKNSMKSSSTFFVHQNLTKDQAVFIEYLEPHGFYVVPDNKREYLDGRKTAQIIGYTGKVNKDDLKDGYYFPTDVTGRLGIEYKYEEYLRGEHGNIFFSRGDSGYITREPQPGDSVVLNIDHDLQIKLYDEIFAVLRDSGLSRGAAIIQNPNNGEVLALVSFPSFDNNIFADDVSEDDYKRLFQNNSKPLFNRIIGGLYNPGSTIKPYIGMAGLEEGVIDDSTAINDCIELVIQNPYDPSDVYKFGNWRTEYGLFNLKRAIANSCNIYFFIVGGGYESAKGLGAERIANYLEGGLAGTLLGIDLPGEERGFVPTPKSKLRDKGEPWYLGDTYNISIGQGDLLVTPLWLNAYVGAIANGGSVLKPKVAREIINNDSEIIQQFKAEEIGRLPFRTEVIQEMKSAMHETVLSGTAKIMQELPVSSGAKTGTAEVAKGRTTNSLFIAFAPYENPEISITVLIEGTTSQQGLAVKAAYQVLKWYFSRI